MFILEVGYKKNELSTFKVWEVDDEELARAYVEAPVIDHVCGYFIRQVEGRWDFDGVPKLQRRLFCGSEHPGAFITKLRDVAVPLTAGDLEKLHADKRDFINSWRKDEKMTNATPAEKPAKKAAKKEGSGEKAPRFSPDPKLKIKKLTDKCPRHDGSKAAKNWELYKGSPTVAKFKELGGKAGFLKNDIKNGHVELVA